MHSVRYLKILVAATMYKQIIIRSFAFLIVIKHTAAKDRKL